MRAANLMTTQAAKIEQGSGAAMLEAIFEVRRNGVFSRGAGPCCKRTVVMFRDPGLPAVSVGGHPQPDRVRVLVVGHVHPFPIMAACHLSAVSFISLAERSTEDISRHCPSMKEFPRRIG